MAHYLVTGAAGFIGARVTGMLLEQGHQVTGADNLNDAYDVRMKEFRLTQLEGRPGFDFRKIDISDWESVEALPAVDAVINLAARAGVRQSVENPWVYVSTNVTGTMNLLELCRRKDIPKFVLASTSSIYGLDAPLPTPEDSSSDHPLSPYSASKKGAEALAHSYHHLYDTDVTIFRYFTVYGPAGRPDMVMFRFAKWITEDEPVYLNGDGEQSRGFTYVDDIARGTILGLKPVGYEIINLGGHEVIKINDLLRMMEGMIGKQAEVVHLPFHKADMLANWADIRKARRMLQWEPQVGLEEGVQKLVDWYNTERAWARRVQT
jgi:nucleoside-diphosphate-sugar epimerase